ncbi:DUF6268 family outer membrane beta-barrel protein [Planctomicrobium sp. SH661]|uniref:DUF6268 family outer membrane beta-barrel protein n=1 Tax=Planctomicrobium sp. SH661 TaxID=3448124 RepID=UPI003F5BA1A2
MQRGTVCLCVFLLAVPGALPVCADEPEHVPAPRQYPQSLYITAHPSLFTIPDPSEAFDENAEPAFLPSEAFQSQPLQNEIVEGLEDDPGLQLIQYPTIDSAARDEDPAGHYSEPRWNPFPFLTEQLAALPKDQKGLKVRETAVTDTVLPQVSDDYGMNTLDIRSIMYFGQLPVLQFAPRFGWHVISDGAPAGLPSQLYDTGLDTSLFLPLTAKWSFLGMAGPSIFTDGQNTTSEAFRMTGRALAFYQWSPATKLSAGFLYLGRADIKAMPAGGIFCKPSDDVKIELFFPRPKVGYRVMFDGESESWCYLAGEFGGGSWAVQQAGGRDDVVSLRDYRLIAGFEHVHGEEFRWLVEAGFVFGRKIEYTSGVGDSTQSPTGMLRGGVAF